MAIKWDEYAAGVWTLKGIAPVDKDSAFAIFQTDDGGVFALLGEGAPLDFANMEDKTYKVKVSLYSVTVRDEPEEKETEILNFQEYAERIKQRKAIQH